LRNKKFTWLDDHDIQNTAWKDLEPASPHYLFIEEDQEGRKTYQEFVNVQDICKHLGGK